MTNNPQNKNVDGIKKIDRGELKQKRKVVLDYIGEELEAANRASAPAPRSRNMDGILKKIKKKVIAPSSPKVSRTVDNNFIKDQKDQLMREVGIEPEVQAGAPKTVQRPVSAIVKRAEEIQKNNEEIKRVSRVPKKVNEDKLRQKRINDEKEKKRQEKLEREKWELEKREKEELQRKAEEKKEKQRKTRKKKAKKAKIKFFKLIVYILERGKKMYANILYYIIVVILSVVLLYLLFALLLLKFNMDNGASRAISSYVPVPALVTKHGTMNYYEYRDLQNKLSNGEDEEEVHLAILKNMILDKLAEKYGVTGKTYEELEGLLSDKIIYDSEINIVAIKRMDNIQKLIAEKNDFVQVAQKYGQTGKVDFDSASEAADEYGDKIVDLKVGEVSSVIVTKDGYYIFRRFENKGVAFALSYVFIPGKTLDEYVGEILGDIKIWSLVD